MGRPLIVFMLNKERTQSTQSCTMLQDQKKLSRIVTKKELAKIRYETIIHKLDMTFGAQDFRTLFFLQRIFPTLQKIFECMTLFD